MASRSLNFYTGVTNNMFQRALQHKCDEVEGFTTRYHIDRLVYYEVFEHVGNAIMREKQIKAWTRAKRLVLIKSVNPTWQYLVQGWDEQTERQIPRSAREAKPSTLDKNTNRDEAITCFRTNNKQLPNAQTH
jgi:putative endonuclease